MIIQKSKRHFLDEHLKIEAWEDLKPYFDDLISRDISQLVDFENWLKDRSELDAVLEEDLAWRYIRMSIETNNESLANDYTFFVTKIQPELAPLEDTLNRKFMESPLRHNYTDSAYKIYFRSIETQVHLFREKNVSIEAELNELAQKYGAISAAQSIEYNGETLTMQKASQLLKEQDEHIRKSVFDLIVERRRVDTTALDDLYSQLIAKRHELALNAGFENFRDYKFQSLGRFDYTKEDCFAFHEAIRMHIVPLVKEIQLKKLAFFQTAQFKPWNLEVDPEGKAPLKPFQTGKEMLDGCVQMLGNLDPYFADCLKTMEEMGHLDLDSKAGKAPGGYNYPLYEIGVPFIFMNAVGAQRDLVTMVHEAGHAVHSFLSRNLSLTGFKNLPSEVAELASMSMELLSMTEWNHFYSNIDDLNRAKREQLEGILKILPWIAQIDAFQHWVYEHPTHSIAERHAHWSKLSKEFGTGLTDWTGYEDQIETSWQRQLHLFEVPFYYIEYGIAQLGALGVWMNSLTDLKKGLHAYQEALKLGYTKSIPEIYKTANVPFDFSSDRLKSLASFIQDELKKLN
ncbi:MAG: M3 family oligoendopeptidase [Flavobacteriales bacterium]